MPRVDGRPPARVFLDPDQGEGAGSLSWEMCLRGLTGLTGYTEGQLRLVCSFCEERFSVPHTPDDWIPVPVRFVGPMLHPECPACRALRRATPRALR